MLFVPALFFALAIHFTFLTVINVVYVCVDKIASKPESFPGLMQSRIAAFFWGLFYLSVTI